MSSVYKMSKASIMVRAQFKKDFFINRYYKCYRNEKYTLLLFIALLKNPLIHLEGLEFVLHLLILRLYVPTENRRHGR